MDNLKAKGLKANCLPSLMHQIITERDPLVEIYKSKLILETFKKK